MIIRKSDNGLKLLEFQIFEKGKALKHCITTRKGGASADKYATLNLSLTVNDTEENVKYNRTLIAEYFKITDDKIYLPQQCHTNNVKIIKETSKIEDLAETDALITNKPGILLGVLTADCVPILLFDPVCKVVAAIHAGWKGTIKNIVKTTINSMSINFNCRPENILAVIGPSISQKRFEVGEEVAVKFKQSFDKNSGIIQFNAETGKDHIDLQKSNRNFLIRESVKPERIESSGLCTYDNTEWFYSARRDGINCGRFGSFIMIV
jgi:YfiH family protein